MKGGDRDIFYVTLLDLSWRDWAKPLTSALSSANIGSADRKKTGIKKVDILRAVSEKWRVNT